MSVCFLIFLILFVTVDCNVNKFLPYDYCDPALKLCEIPSSHTMCRYPVPGISADCTPNINQPLSSLEKLEILYLHNKLRDRVARGSEKNDFANMPQASNMLQMYWDYELETIAERWANRCLNITFANTHDDCRNTKRFNVSQNVATVGSRGITPDNEIAVLFQQWYQQEKFFKVNDTDLKIDEKHDEFKDFINIIWASSYSIGCSRVIFQNSIPNNKGAREKSTLWTFQRLVCNYGPAGNILGSSIYKKGAPCSDCPEGSICSTKYSGLCAFNDVEPETKLKGLGLPLKADTEVNYDKIENKQSSVSTVATVTTKATTEVKTTVATVTLKEVTFKKKLDITSDPMIKKEEFNDSKTKNTVLKAGIYFKGKCHCSDITRYGFNTLQNDTLKKFNHFAKPRDWALENSSFLTENSSRVREGDRCYCRKFTSNGIGCNGCLKYQLLLLTLVIHTLCLLNKQ